MPREKRFRARPSLGVLQEAVLSASTDFVEAEIVRFVLNSSRSRKSVLCLLLHTAFLRTLKIEPLPLQVSKSEFEDISDWRLT
jgi:hypothetical protein